MGRMTWMRPLASTCLFLLVFGIAGCQKKDGEPSDSQKPGAKTTGTAQRTTPNRKDTTKPPGAKPDDRVVQNGTGPDQPAPPIAQVPRVTMSKQHRDALAVFQNDALSDSLLDGQLLGLDGKTHTLRSELGKSLTVLLFWSSDHAYAVEELGYLAGKVAHEFGSDGVKIVTINQRDSEEQAKETVAHVGASALVTLLDPDKSLATLAKGNVPRTYLLDPQGRVLWLDTVFDRTTKRDLNGAMDFVLNKSAVGAGASTAQDSGESKHR